MHVLGVKLAATERQCRRHDGAIPIGQAMALFDVERRHENVRRRGLHLEARPRYALCFPACTSAMSFDARSKCCS